MNGEPGFKEVIILGWGTFDYIPIMDFYQK